MPGFMPGIHVFQLLKQGVDGRDIGVRKHAVLRTAMPGHDDCYAPSLSAKSAKSFAAKSTATVGAGSPVAGPYSLGLAV